MYENIRMPLYNPYARLAGTEPELYAADGKRVRTFFLRDAAMAQCKSQVSPHILWDRYNFGLPHHFYTHEAMAEIMGEPRALFGMLIETPGIWPAAYEMLLKDRGLAREYSHIFTYDEKILDSLPNADFVPFCAQVKSWIPNKFGSLDVLDMKQLPIVGEKTKNVSIVSSDKTMCALHNARIKCATKCKNEGIADTFGTFSGGRLCGAEEALAPYRFSIVYENTLAAFCFTEKLTNCFAYKTIPIYVGTPKVAKFFNSDGIIFATPHGAADIARKLDAKEYERRIDAANENYEIAKKYLDIWEECIFEPHLEKLPYGD
ncbi:MAG: hypothetical protein LBD33_00050 [Puniceicoccales bacterium]|nr:hypothetical protein [Puniceicoccales bacterium]